MTTEPGTQAQPVVAPAKDVTSSEARSGDDPEIVVIDVGQNRRGGREGGQDDDEQPRVIYSDIKKGSTPDSSIQSSQGNTKPPPPKSEQQPSGAHSGANHQPNPSTTHAPAQGHAATPALPTTSAGTHPGGQHGQPDKAGATPHPPKVHARVMQEPLTIHAQSIVAEDYEMEAMALPPPDDPILVVDALVSEPIDLQASDIMLSAAIVNAAPIPAGPTARRSSTAAQDLQVGATVMMGDSPCEVTFISVDTANKKVEARGAHLFENKVYKGTWGINDQVALVTVLETKYTLVTINANNTLKLRAPDNLLTEIRIDNEDLKKRMDEMQKQGLRVHVYVISAKGRARVNTIKAF
ncbi:hypothetical protein DFQ27_007305 [Actinomortierella ambigua]|uniref:Uncharacterized protein n=1 Tax=Actinomortierella ambigua TaxID=1343610 RepID=A0A9P6QJP5_9FUNG|nr:hypothetical protein DFQ27_007305 [Actinomortierella ambigua]